MTLTATLLSATAAGFTGSLMIGQAFAEKTAHTENPKQETSLEDLFNRLKNEADRDRAAIIAKSIIKKIKQSKNKTVELLMTWSDQAYHQRKDIGTALDLLDQITVLDPNYAEAWNRRATLFFEQDKLGRSIKDIERVLAIEPRHFGALSGLAMILERIGYPQKAEKTWLSVLEIYPANRRAQSAYIRLLEKNAAIKH